MAIVSNQGKYIEPCNYFAVTHAHHDKLVMESPALSAMVDSWSKAEHGTVSGLDANANSLTLESGKELSYKSLVLSPGFDCGRANIKGLTEMAASHTSNKTFVHAVDTKFTIDDNYWHGVGHSHGDFICYSPAVPYKGEGTDFYAFYYEHLLR